MEMQNLAESIRAGISLSADHRTGGPIEYGIIKIRDVQDGVAAPTTALDNVSPPGARKAADHALLTGDILVALLGNLGKVVVIGPEHVGCLADKHWGVVRSAKHGERIAAFLQSDPGQDAMAAARTGAFRPGLTLGALRAIDIP